MTVYTPLDQTDQTRLGDGRHPRHAPLALAQAQTYSDAHLTESLSEVSQVSEVTVQSLSVGLRRRRSRTGVWRYRTVATAVSAAGAQPSVLIMRLRSLKFDSPTNLTAATATELARPGPLRLLHHPDSSLLLQDTEHVVGGRGERADASCLCAVMSGNLHLTQVQGFTPDSPTVVSLVVAAACWCQPVCYCCHCQCWAAVVQLHGSTATVLGYSLSVL